jgi:hypothetical protein
MGRLSSKLLSGVGVILLFGGITASVLVANNSNNNIISLIRETDLDGNGHNFLELFSEFDNPRFFVNNGTLNFSGQKLFSSNEFQEVELLDYDQFIIENTIQATYNFSFNKYTNDAVLSSTLIVENNEIESESLYGKAFMNNKNNMDILFDVDGSNILLSDLENDVLRLQNCG